MNLVLAVARTLKEQRTSLGMQEKWVSFSSVLEAVSDFRVGSQHCYSGPLTLVASDCTH